MQQPHIVAWKERRKKKRHQLSAHTLVFLFSLSLFAPFSFFLFLFFSFSPINLLDSIPVFNDEVSQSSTTSMVLVNVSWLDANSSFVAFNSSCVIPKVAIVSNSFVLFINAIAASFTAAALDTSLVEQQRTERAIEGYQSITLCQVPLTEDVKLLT